MESIAEEIKIIKGEIITANQLEQYDIPQVIIDEMKKWDVIYKSPYGSSFYNTTEIDWNYKPDGSLRVSNHWNFSTNRTKFTGRIHCKTNKRISNNVIFALAKYNSSIDTYRILLSSPLTSITKILEYKRSDENINKCREFSQRIKNNEIFASFNIDGENYKGRVIKLSNTSLRVVDEKDNIIFSSNNSSRKISKLGDLHIVDSNNNILENPYKI